ncbi:nucleoside ABC transporter membrane protein [Aliiroseovarius crassostreae]|uniref:Sugar ABC transporter permease n=1 Tax=Aliiroseovarius crassostreae TaxID=154981 RepID=A0A0P7KIY0_9RHOB|nr:ABC transporter permease [Aliiroseovarius crassostreae]KPN63565.1 sugar ABC transporter permease [Aliiroseovarius crassostreae]SFU85009.1 nucleoside ABC transporter membrane protein [Aliiroseovarius crassostreae]
MDFLTIIQILDSALRMATPLLLACLAGLISERSGVFDIGLEGKILVAAFFSAAVAAHYDSVWWGMLAGIMVSIGFSLVHGVASITFRGNQLISGVALNFLASGLTVLIGNGWFGLGGRTPTLEGPERFDPIPLPFADAVKDVPYLGPIYSDLLSGHTLLVYVALLLVPVTWYGLYRTRFGLRLRAVGENPAAVDTAGVSVIRLRYIAMVIAGALCGLAGIYLATGLSSGFGKEMSAGRGFIALAALIFAKWKPVPALGATLLFGLLQAISIRYPKLEIGPITLPSQFMEALPYILTVIILAGFIGKAVPPKAGGEPYVKER